jgi:uncharacterized protein (UPF0332 family)
MINEKRKKEASMNFRNYLHEGLIKKETNILAKEKYIDNATLSLRTANELIKSNLKPYLWVIVISYYSMFYVANAVLLQCGYKTGDKIAHKVTYDSLIVLVLDKFKDKLFLDFEDVQNDALDIMNARVESIIESYSLELNKRSTFQYNMLEETKESKARTSLIRAEEFMREMKKLLITNYL